MAKLELRPSDLQSDQGLTVTSNGAVIVDATSAARLLKENGTLERARAYMTFVQIRSPSNQNRRRPKS